MSNQGLWGAIQQYWTVEPQPRLHRKNTYFEDTQVSNAVAFRFGLAVSVLATAIVVFWSLLGVLL